MRKDFYIEKQRFLCCDGELLCTFYQSSLNYVDAVLDTLNALEDKKRGKGIIDYWLVNKKLQAVIRKPYEPDFKEIKTPIISSDIKSDRLGNKYRCGNCGKSYYDLRGSVRACPSCKTPRVSK